MTLENPDCIVKFGYSKPKKNLVSVEVVNAETNETLETFTQPKSEFFTSNNDSDLSSTLSEYKEPLKTR